MQASSGKPIAEFVVGSQPRIEVFACERRETPVSPYLFGKFTEHLGSNIYNGMWAQILGNTGFEPGEHFDPRGDDQRADRLALIEQYLGVPGMVESRKQGVAYAWARYGEGEVSYALDADRVNSDTSQRIEVRSLTSPEAGIRQGVCLPLHRTGRYELSVWVKGTGGTLYIAIHTADDRKLGGATLTDLSAEWQRRTVRFTVECKGVSRGQVLRLSLGLREPGTLWLDQCFLFPADHKHGFDPEIVRLTRDSKVGMLRYPGGNFASGYHWKDGIGPVDERPIRHNAPWNRDEPNHVGTDEFLTFCRLVRCEPLVCVNAGNGTPEEAADWVEYCNGDVSTKYGALRARNGHPKPYGVKYWEIGNELYGGWQIGHCSAEEYADRYARFYEAMRAVDASIKLIANGQDPNWNAPIIERDARILRSLSIHLLMGSSIPADTSPETVFRSFMALPVWCEEHLKGLGQQMAQGGVTEPRLAITELQIFTKKWELPNNRTVTEALSWAGMFNSAVRLGNLVEIITHSALVNHGAGLRKERGVVFADPVYWAQRMYAAQPGRWPVRLRISCLQFSVPELHDLPAVENVPYLDAVALLDDSGKELNLLVTNRHPTDATTVRIALNGFTARPEVSVQTLGAPDFMAQNTLGHPDAILPKNGVAKCIPEGLTYTFPACSLTRLAFRSAK